jgi:hypothetical protein
VFTHTFFIEIYAHNDNAMRIKQRRKQPARKRKRSIADVVEAMAARGEPEDAIALEVNLNKNTLRRRHILEIARGRAAKAQAADVGRVELHAINAILTAFHDGTSSWNVPEGNLLWPGVHADCAQSPADAFARWLLDGGRFIVSGLSTPRFSRERLREFADVRAAAEKLLQKYDRAIGRMDIQSRRPMCASGVNLT